MGGALTFSHGQVESHVFPGNSIVGFMVGPRPGQLLQTPRAAPEGKEGNEPHLLLGAELSRLALFSSQSSRWP